MDTVGGKDSHIGNYNKFMKQRRKASKKIAISGLHTISVPPASSGIFLEKVKSIYPQIPVIAHLKTGRIHIVSNDDNNLASLRKLSLAIGGKIPREWNYLQTKGIKSILTDAELSIVKSLKKNTLIW